MKPSIYTEFADDYFGEYQDFLFAENKEDSPGMRKKFAKQHPDFSLFEDDFNDRQVEVIDVVTRGGS